MEESLHLRNRVSVAKSATLKILHGLLMLLSRPARIKRPLIPPLPRLGIFLP
jgi:hypothetical protein